MPKYLKNDALRLIEGGLECYLLSLMGLNSLELRERKISDTRYAPVIGLLGATVELIVKGCLVQAKGINILYKQDKFYKYGSESIEELKNLIKSKDTDVEYLWIDSENPEIIIENLLDSIERFKLLQTYRANGLHAGFGPNRDVVIITFNEVYNFIQILSNCKN